ncbi:hypothetical protein AERO8C_50565 [Aeromonas veronii]|uniref:Uncharacterized protein n=1 Tax=Aeromonas veronii TaxID=654 RepID=A0A653LB91_AERVE|nr:hypothetical protein AERO8C_50565 [Aeromonas veronii]
MDPAGQSATDCPVGRVHQAFAAVTLAALKSSAMQRVESKGEDKEWRQEDREAGILDRITRHAPI